MLIYMKKIKPIWIVLILALLLLAVMLVSFTLGRYGVSVGDVLEVLFGGAASRSGPKATVVLNIRLPRILLACLVGCCLSSAGAAYQGVFQNPMAAPDILGASSGAAFGAALAILLGLSGRMITVFAFAFSLLSIAAVFLVGQRAKGKQVLTLILAGIMISSLFSAGTSYIKLVADPSDQLPAISYWMMGSLAGKELRDVSFVLPSMLIGLVPLLLLRWRINILTLGDEEARTMGINAGRLRLIVILCATLITAASVSVSGMIGWVGLVIPHLARRLVGNDYKYLLPTSLLAGGVFLLLVDNVSRCLTQTEIPIGILTAVIGSPFFIFLITKRGESA